MRKQKPPYKKILEDYLIRTLAITNLRDKNTKTIWEELCIKYDLGEELSVIWSDDWPKAVVGKKTTPWAILAKRVLLKNIQEDGRGASPVLSNGYPHLRLLNWIELCEEFEIFPQELIDRYK